MTDQTQLLIFWGVFLVFIVVVYFCDKYFNLLRDTSTAAKKPYSFSRVQLTWWSSIILSSFITILFTKNVAPTLDNSTLILLGISMVTTAASSAIDMADIANPNIQRAQDTNGVNLIQDILSDGNGINMHRFQTVVFNALFGVWFLYMVTHNLVLCPAVPIKGIMVCVKCATDPSTLPYNTIMPVICQNNLILLGLSSGTYVALKTNENKKPVDTRLDTVPDESGNAEPPAVG